MQFTDYCWRIGLALLLGALIGFERNKRTKEAGIRTHGLVCLGACVFMLLSQFAMDEALGKDWDASRIASQTVMGIAFLGAGMIYSKGGAIQGMTTAAGVWTTVAIGMCCGSSNVFFAYIAIIVTAVIILFQLIFYKPPKFLMHRVEKVVRVKFLKSDETTVDSFKKYGKIVGYSLKREGEYTICSCNISLKNTQESDTEIDNIFAESKNVLSVEILKLADK